MNADGEMQQAHQKAVEAQRRYDEEGHKIEAALLASRPTIAEQPRSGQWTVERIEPGALRVQLNGKLVALVVSLAGELVIIAGSPDESPDNPSPLDIAAAAHAFLARGGVA